MKSTKAILPNYYCYFFIFLLVVSCSKRRENLPGSRFNPEIQNGIANEAKKFNSRNIFGASFAKAISKSQSLRSLIKTEANKYFDGISDILYCDISGKTIGGTTVNNFIKQFAADKNTFQAAVDQSPLLTIYVPTLPSDWNLPNWNEKTEIPSVAIEQNCLSDERTINFYDAAGKLDQISDTLIPGFPTLVIKENNRVCLKSYADLMTRTYSPGSDFPVFYESVNNQELYFLLDLNKMKTNPIDKSASSQNSYSDNLHSLDFLYNNPNGTLSPEVLTAYNFFGTSWPRDYIYYGLTPNKTNGLLNGNIVEHIKHFWFNSSASFPQITTETGDPQIIKFKLGLTSACWTSGAYNITFTILINAKNGIGQTIQKTTPISPDQVWSVTYTRRAFNLYSYSSIKPIPADIDVEMLPFDLTNYSVAWKISVEDTRPTQTQSYNVSYSSQFAENISFDPSFGLFKKIGLKFGASTTSTETQTHTVSTNLGSISLGDIVLNYYDPVIVYETGSSSSPSTATTLDYSTGAVGVSIVPTRRW